RHHAARRDALAPEVRAHRVRPRLRQPQVGGTRAGVVRIAGNLDPDIRIGVQRLCDDVEDREGLGLEGRFPGLEHHTPQDDRRPLRREQNRAAGGIHPGAGGRARAAVILRGVMFETGKSALKPESFTVLDIVAQSLQANPDIRIEIAGYTDNTGAAATNAGLSQARAEAVRMYLATRGVTPNRMVAKGYGPANPIAPNTTAAGRAQNRRVELHQLP